MKRILGILLLVLNGQAAFGATLVPAQYIQVTPTYATDHRIYFTHFPESDAVMVGVDYEKDRLAFDEARLICTNSLRHFYIPLKGTVSIVAPAQGKKPQTMRLMVSFSMDRQMLRESSLQIVFMNKPDSATIYVLSPKDFIPKVEAPSHK
jgi:hypothetical protein